MKTNFSLLFISILFLFSFITEEDERGKAFADWYRQNHRQLISTQKNGDFDVSLRYLPTELDVFKELKSDPSRDVKKSYQKHIKTDKYNFKIGVENTALDIIKASSETQQEYDDKIYYLSMDVHQDFKIVSDTDTIPILNCQFERNYGAAPYVKLALTFAHNTTKNARLLYEDKLFNLGDVSFDLHSIKPNNIPRIQ